MRDKHTFTVSDLTEKQRDFLHMAYRHLQDIERRKCTGWVHFEADVVQGGIASQHVASRFKEL